MEQWSRGELVNFIMNSVQDGNLLNEDLQKALELLKTK